LSTYCQPIVYFIVNIIMKMRFYNEGGSEKHIHDITGMLKISGDAIDMEYITACSSSLCSKDSRTW